MELTETDRKAMSKHFSELKKEMSFDTKQLSEQSKLKTLLATKVALEKKLQKMQDDNRALERSLSEEKQMVDKVVADSEEIKADIQKFDAIEIKDEEKEYV